MSDRVEWLLDPQECVARLSPWREPCKALTSRNEAHMKATRVVYTTEGDGKRRRERWAFGHVHAERTNKGIELKVFETPTTYTGTHPLSPQEAQYSADVLRAAVAQTDGKACAGKSIQELVWDELLTVVDRLMTDQPAEDGRDPGRAEGLAFALAVFQNPYRPNIEAIKDQAMDMWDEEQGE